MTGPCPYFCNNKTELGYCLTTACINPNYYLKNIPIMTPIYTYGNPCQKCPNNLSNGGSGICHCILGAPIIT